jgi:hypothetical protein
MYKKDRVEEFVILYRKYGSIRSCARSMGISFGTAQILYTQSADAGLIVRRPPSTKRTREEIKDELGKLHGKTTFFTAVPAQGAINRYIVTCAQNNTSVNKPVWDNLLALASHYGARIMVSRFVYDRRSQRSQEKDADPAVMEDIWWPPEVVPYLSDEREQLAPGLIWCGEMNIMPTAVRPLSGLDTYTGRASSIFPSPNLALESVPSAKHDSSKMMFTTGTVTLRNYIQRKAGFKAEHHHTYGALIVEVDSSGNWFVRQLNADSSGDIYDLTLCASKGEVTDAHKVEAINWGDIHVPSVDPMVSKLAWGEGGILDTLRPKYQLVHDLIDFRARNHHERGNPHANFEKWLWGLDSVEMEIEKAACFLQDIERDFTETVVVESNHDQALGRWLRESDHRTDPVNAIYYLTASLAKYKSMQSDDNTFHLLEWAITNTGVPNAARFLKEDESLVICHEHEGGIECGSHGHRGLNGSRGSPQAFSKMSRKMNLGHSHTSAIKDGVYYAGTSSLLDLGYNVGPSSWSHSAIVTYVNGKRAIVTMFAGKWRA